jgi:sugar lactone lactonase YvrE
MNALIKTHPAPVYVPPSRSRMLLAATKRLCIFLAAAFSYGALALVSLVMVAIAGVSMTGAVQVGAAGATSPASAVRQATVLLHTFPGDQVFPESVAVDHKTGRFYVGSVKDGTLYTGKVGVPGELRVFSPAGADGRTIATGVAFADGRLVVAGRQTGQIFVYDTRTAKLVTRLDTGLRAGQTFLNDVAIAPDGSAYVTDSTAPILWRAKPVESGYLLERFMSFNGTAVHYISAPGAPGINVNGIAAVPGGRYLIIGKRNENALYRVDLARRTVRAIEMPAGTLDLPDGMALRGRTLRVVQNLPGSIKTLTLAADFGSARGRGEFSHESFAFPTGIALHRGRLLVVSSQFNSLGSPAAITGTTPPKLPFWVSELRIPSR